MKETLETTVEAINSWSEVVRYYPIWREILNSNPLLTIFSTPEWLESWWASYASKCKLLFLIVRDGYDEIIALVPLFQSVGQSAFGNLRLCRFVGDGSEDSDNLEPVYRYGKEQAVARAIYEWAGSNSLCHIVQFNTLPCGPLMEALKSQINAHPLIGELRTRPRTIVNLPRSWDEYLKLLSSKERFKIGNLSRRLEKIYSVRCFRCETDGQVDDCLDILFRLHQMRWSLRNQPGSFCIPERRDFYRGITRAFLSQGWLEFWFLELNHTAVAAQFAFRFRDSAYALQEGFDPSYSSDSVGYILRSYVLRKMIDAGVRRYDFLGGEGNSKSRWAGEPSEYVDIHFAHRYSRGGAYLVARRDAIRCKAWARRHLTNGVFGILKALLTGRIGREPQKHKAIEEHREPHLSTLSLWS
jgi:CelD/BcsL family acetyltransferase involved in cellulose biosynthesis